MTGLLAAVLGVVSYLLNIYTVLLFIGGVLHWVRADMSLGIVQFLLVLTDPPAKYLLQKFPRLLIHKNNMILDLSPLVLILGIGCLNVFIKNLQGRL